MIEAALADCDMLTQLCRKYNTAPLPPINRVYLAREKKGKKKEKKNKSGSYIEAWPFFSPHHFPSRKRWKGAILPKKENLPRIWNRSVERSKSLGDCSTGVELLEMEARRNIGRADHRKIDRCVSMKERCTARTVAEKPVLRRTRKPINMHN